MIADLYHGSYGGSDPDPREPGCPHDVCDQIRVDDFWCGDMIQRPVLVCVACCEELVRVERRVTIRGAA